MIVTKKREKIRWKLFFEQRDQSNMAAELHLEIARAKHVRMDALQALGEDPPRKPHCESRRFWPWCVLDGSLRGVLWRQDTQGGF